jgi:glycosyltransferase involved in cell wall biosynthesis
MNKIVKINKKFSADKSSFPGNIKTDIRAIAIHLPQFHAIEENNLWWGKGFTEWTNVRSAESYYQGHYQPHVPHSDIGYYDLNDESVLERQAQMARENGIEGFCFYYYWFEGKRLLEMPTDRMLASGKPDFPFCFCWANENWTRTWDGGDHEVLISQDYSDLNNEKIIRDLIPAFKDKRYIRVNGRPLFIVYRPTAIPNFPKVAKLWRKICKEEDVGEIYLCGKRGFHHLKNTKLGLNASIQFPPLLTRSIDLRDTKDMQCRDGFQGLIHDYREMAALNAFIDEKEGKIFNGICPSWDNTARRKQRSTSWINSSPENYYKWLKVIVDRTRKIFSLQERLIFINAWNEWAEGCHLEPDNKYGYAWLNATKKALCSSVTLEQDRKLRVLVVGHDAARAGAQIVLLTMLREWQKQGKCDFKLVLLGDGVLRKEFEVVCDTLVLKDHATDDLKKLALEAFSQPVPDVILANTSTIGSTLESLKQLGVPIVAYIHELQKSIERWAPGPIMRATVENSDHFIAVSAPVADNLHRTHRIPPEKISSINEYITTSDCVSLERLQILRAELGIQPHEKIVFGCGTMDWRKGPDLFAKAALEVLKKIPEARFFWIGSDMGDEYSTSAHRLAKDARIRFLGERENPRDYLALGHVFFLSSREDPFPLVALEAADAGIPVVCFADAGGMPEFVGNTCGCTIPFENTKAAAEALMELLINERIRKKTGLMAQNKVRAKHDAAQGSAAVLSILKGFVEPK